MSGVGEKRAQLLASEVGIRTVGDLLHYYPYRYIDRTKVYKIASLTEEQSNTHVQLRGRVMGFAYLGEGPKKRLSVSLSDGTGVV